MQEKDIQKNVKEIAEYLNSKLGSKYFCSLVFVTESDKKKVNTATLTLTNLDTSTDSFEVVKSILGNFKANTEIETGKFFQLHTEKEEKRPQYG
jgi:hypothetical protein